MGTHSQWKIRVWRLSQSSVCVCVSQLSITGSAIWINPFVGVLTIIALWPVDIMFMHLRTTLRSLKIIPKYAMYQVSPNRHPDNPSAYGYSTLYTYINVCVCVCVCSWYWS